MMPYGGCIIYSYYTACEFASLLNFFPLLIKISSLTLEKDLTLLQLVRVNIYVGSVIYYLQKLGIPPVEHTAGMCDALITT